MNVLLFEDRGSAAYYIKEWLESEQHIVLSAHNANDAQTYWRNRGSTPVHCIILDLQVPVVGLSEKQKKRASDGVLSGWVWLYDNVLSEAPEMRSRIIIYSDYLPDLKHHVREKDYAGITLIPKRERSSSARDVADRIKGIALMMQSQNSHSSAKA